MDSFWEQLRAISWVDWLGMITGIIGVWLSIKEKAAAWPAFIICYASYVYVSYLYGYYAFLGMNVVFIGISLYGWIQWSRPNRAQEPEHPITHTRPSHWLPILLILASGTVVIAWLLNRNGEAEKPYFDAFATCAAFIAQWMLVRKHLETWIFWICSNLVYLGLFAVSGSWPTVILFATFIALAIKGWKDWKQELIRR